MLINLSWITNVSYLRSHPNQGIFKNLCFCVYKNHDVNLHIHIGILSKARIPNCKAKNTLSFWEYFQIYMYVQAAYMNCVSWEPRHYISIIDLCLQKSQLLNIFKSSCCFLMSNCVDGRPNFTITKQFLEHWLVESYVWYKYSPWKTMQMMRWWHNLFFSFSPVHFPEKLQWKWTSKPSMSLLKTN